MALLLSGEDLRACLPMEDAVIAIEEALSERHARTAASPPRMTWEVPPSAMTISPGGFQKMGALGFRVYVRGVRDDQMTAIWDIHDGHMECIIVGPELGQIRTGAIGGVALKWMAPRDPRRVAIVGGGPQSRTQLLALRAVRPKIDEVMIYRRDAGRRKEIVRRWGRELGISVRPAGSALEAVRGAQIVILATDSSTPVIKAQSLLPGAT